SLPKSGTNWLKSLIFTIVNRIIPNHHPLIQNSPLLSHNPHELVYFLENGVYGGYPLIPTPQQLQQLPLPRLLNTHLPYASYPESIKTSSCKIVYIARNPLDTFVSQWHWQTKLIKSSGGEPNFQPPSVECYFEDFCLGKFLLGPYFDMLLSSGSKYDDLKSDQAVLHMKKLADFLGFRFSEQEESEGVIDDIMELCNINNLKELEHIHLHHKSTMNNDNQNESDETIQLQKFEEQAEQLIQSLEKVKFMGSKVEIVKYQNFWCRAQGLKSILHYQ
ncbi:Cytosolic sulfotransferase 15, partial [Bienertia sinuspersici]